MTSSAPLATILKQYGYSVTKQRQAVFAALHDQEPLSMRQVVGQCPAIDRASVYRTIGLFEKLGIVQRLQSGWKYKLELSGAFHIHHHHATCLSCGTTIKLPEHTALEKQLREIAETHRFHLQSHQLELQGYCSNCASKPFPL